MSLNKNSLNRILLFFFLFLICNQILSQNNVSGTWEGIMYNDSTKTEKEIIVNVVLPSLSKTHKCGYEEALVKAFFKEKETKDFIEYDGVLSFDCFSINIYSQELYGKDFYFSKNSNYLQRNENSYEDYKDLLPITYTTMQLILKKEKPYGYWQKQIKNSDASSTIIESGKITFKKHIPLKRA